MRPEKLKDRETILMFAANSSAPPWSFISTGRPGCCSGSCVLAHHHSVLIPLRSTTVITRAWMAYKFLGT